MLDDENEIWDEFKWEEFMREQDKKVDRYMELFYRYYNHPDRDEIIAREMGWTWLLDRPEAENEEGSSRFEDEIDDVEEGEEWKRAAGVESDDEELFDFESLPVYQRAKDFALHAMHFVDELPESVREDSAVVDFLSNAMIAPAKIAGGTGIGNDIEELGGNIAYCKRGLAAANLTIAALHEMREKGILAVKVYLDLVKEATEVRNRIAVYILDLREKFQRGV
jgi:hypothetical protein